MFHLHNLWATFLKWAGISKWAQGNQVIRYTVRGKKLAGAYVNDWQHGTRQSFFANTHISHIIMWGNSVEWVVSVVTHFQLEKFCRKTYSDTQQLLLPKHCVPIAWSFEGGQGEWVAVFTLLFIFWLRCLVWLAVWQQTFPQMMPGENLQVVPIAS